MESDPLLRGKEFLEQIKTIENKSLTTKSDNFN